MQPDATRIREDIHNLREQAETLEELATRRIKIHHDTAHGRMSSAPTPLNLPAQDLLDQIHALALRLAYAAGLRFGRGMDVHGLLKGIDRPEPCEVLAARGDAWGIVRLVDDAAWRARQLTDPSPSLRYAGICPRCRSGVWIPETQPLTTEYRCTECGHVEPLATITQAHELRLLTSGTMDTAANLCHLLCACGIHVKRNTITQWRKRKRITPVGKDEQGRPVYALADVLLLRRAVDR